MSPTEYQLYVRFVVGDLTIDGVTVGLDCSFKSTKEVLYATVIFVIVIQEVNQLFYFFTITQMYFLKYFPSFVPSPLNLMRTLHQVSSMLRIDLAFISWSLKYELNGTRSDADFKTQLLRLFSLQMNRSISIFMLLR